MATKNSKGSEKSRVLILTAVVSPACLSSSDRSFLGLPTDSVVVPHNLIRANSLVVSVLWR